jgi:hypothetical protein
MISECVLYDSTHPISLGIHRLVLMHIPQRYKYNSFLVILIKYGTVLMGLCSNIVYDISLNYINAFILATFLVNLLCPISFLTILILKSGIYYLTFIYVTFSIKLVQMIKIKKFQLQKVNIIDQFCYIMERNGTFIKLLAK